MVMTVRLWWLVAATLLLGLAAAVLVTAAAEPADRTFAAVSGPVQSLMSVLVPLIGVLLVKDRVRLGPALLTATLVAAAIGAVGALTGAVVLAVAPSGAGADRWRHAALIAVGGVLVQVGAQFVGTGLGLLLRPAAVAFLATIVLPLGLWWVLGIVETWRPAQPWLTPFPTVQHLLSGRMSALAWAQWLAVVLLWGAALNTAGVMSRRVAAVRRSG